MDYENLKDSTTTYKEATERYKHENKERLCYCCNELQENESDIIKLEISNRGYGSSFDGSDSYIQLCNKCLKPEYIKWFNEEPTMDGYCEEYNYEDDIRNLVKSFPLENQEYFWNSNCNGWTSDVMDRQDWLDMMNEVMTDEKYKEYHMYSPSEIKAYEERFPTCGIPMNVIYDDNSKGCRCLLGASGDYGQQVSINISMECYQCESYCKRENPIVDLTDAKYEEFEKEFLGSTTRERFEKAINKFKDKYNMQNL